MKKQEEVPRKVRYMVYEDNLEELQKYLKDTKKPVSLASLLYLAVGDSPRVLLWLLSKQDPNVRDEESRTPLMSAAVRENPFAVQALLDAGAHINTLSEFGLTALSYAAGQGYNEMVELLLENGADINLGDDWTPLMHAAFAGQFKTVKLLVLAGADMTRADEDGDTAESFAVKEGHKEIAQFLRYRSSK